MRLLAVVVLAALVCGCICCGGKDPGSFLSQPGKDAETQGETCERPYIQVGSECCLDDNGNGICDQDEENTPTTAARRETTTTEPVTATSEATETTAPPTTAAETASSTTTTTVAPNAPSCSDGIQNQKEDYVDCGDPCENCAILRIESGWKEFKGSGYKFRLVGKEGSGQNLKYNLEVMTPDKVTDTRPLSTGESFLDYLRFNVTKYGDDKPALYVRVNVEDLAEVASKHPGGSLLTIGGQSCAQAGSPMCERNYLGYRIRYVSRAEGGARIIIYGLDGVPMTPQDVTDSKLAFSEDHMIGVGGFFDRQHFIQGGSSLFYLYQL